MGKIELSVLFRHVRISHSFQGFFVEPMYEIMEFNLWSTPRLTGQFQFL